MSRSRWRSPAGARVRPAAAEDGAIPARYPLHELSSRGARARTKRNVQDADGTLILFRERPTGGSAYTAQVAQKEGRPCYEVNLATHTDPGEAKAWIDHNQIQVLNVAGPREGQAPGIYDAAAAYFRELFRIADRGPEAQRSESCFEAAVKREAKSSVRARDKT